MNCTIPYRNSKIVKAVLIIISILVSTTTAFAVDTRGARSCGVWIKERQPNGGGGISSQTWLVGYLSGLAVGLGKDFMKGTDNDSIYLWVDNYCRANPLEHLLSAGEELATELIRKKNL